ncbi:MAG: hypothetical protein PHS37_06565 [Candidatus Omnitrophica bacterium]|nr:hypothetical protein [Candidatus Omnitrophota bacterium]
MKGLIKSRVQGPKGSMARFSARVEGFEFAPSRVGDFMGLISAEMKALDYDRIQTDKAGNLIGVIKGYTNKEAVILLSPVDIIGPNRQKLEGADPMSGVLFKAGIISSLYTGALIKRTMLPLQGDLIVVCVPRLECCDFGIKYLFGDFLKARIKKIKGVVLCEPTDFNVNLGHKGRMEYEIVVRGRLNRNFLENRGMNMLGTMFPLINELEKVSKELPSDYALGRSELRIKDVRYKGCRPQDELNEFRIVVDRGFIPEESQGFILNKAKAIAKAVYKQEPDVTVSTLLAKERVKTYTGLELLSEKEFKPWSMESHKPFALTSLKSLTENGFKSKFGYWKKIITDGSYTYAHLNIPTIGFGAGREDDVRSRADMPGLDQLARAAYGLTFIVFRNIGMPTFGWSSDEI